MNKRINNTLSFVERKFEGEKEFLEKKGFIPPSMEEVIAYAQSMNIPEKTVHAWYDYWEQTDWQLGKWQPKNWRKNFQFWVKRGAEIYASGMGMPPTSQRSLTQLEKDKAILEQDRLLERAQREKSDQDFDPEAAKAFFSRHHNWC